MLLSSCILLSLLPLIRSTTEWWGDLRAHMNPPRSPAFYDVTYDDSECNSGLRADAIPEYVYFGTMVATFSVAEHDECLRKCLEKPKCKSVNFFFPLASQDKAFCELLSETQHDNPRLMRPFRRAIHYENIRCKEVEDSEDDKFPVLPSTSATPKSTSTTVAPVAGEKKTVGIPRPGYGGSKQDLSVLMKKLAAKLTDFKKDQFINFRA
ncbi:hypothetical protein PFISCL1PPCAC_10879 [Pristionchus fissidentatus]|uniref:Apple domain-containing protein n=1 Tax=Pristionchus fissidentatus TaxID=1538716 RepID=A0AAV5VIL4_9BILA|nr:hypothetical protein PFISCL1PPCAC_10879 [Pristionchus fissidentatus]